MCVSVVSGVGSSPPFYDISYHSKCGRNGVVVLRGDDHDRSGCGDLVMQSDQLLRKGAGGGEGERRNG